MKFLSRKISLNCMTKSVSFLLLTGTLVSIFQKFHNGGLRLRKRAIKSEGISEHFSKTWSDREEMTNISNTTMSPKILCYILSSPWKLDASKMIQDTWGSDCNKIVFYGGFKIPRNSSLEITYINTTEGFSYLWGKSKRALLHLEKHYSKDFQWFLKADDDTFVVMENLRNFVSKLNPNDSIVFGYKLKNFKFGIPYMSGGAGYVFTSTALGQVASLLKGKSSLNSSSPNCNTRSDIGYEDLELGKCFAVAGVQTINTRDSHGRERFLPLELEVFLQKNLSSFHWLWRKSWNHIRLGNRCCSPGLISFHKVKLHQMKSMYDFLKNGEHKQKMKL